MDFHLFYPENTIVMGRIGATCCSHTNNLHKCTICMVPISTYRGIKAIRTDISTLCIRISNSFECRRSRDCTHYVSTLAYVHLRDTCLLPSHSLRARVCVEHSQIREFTHTVGYKLISVTLRYSVCSLLCE